MMIPRHTTTVTFDESYEDDDVADDAIVSVILNFDDDDNADKEELQQQLQQEEHDDDDGMDVLNLIHDEDDQQRQTHPNFVPIRQDNIMNPNTDEDNLDLFPENPMNTKKTPTTNPTHKKKNMNVTTNEKRRKKNPFVVRWYDRTGGGCYSRSSNSRGD